MSNRAEEIWIALVTGAFVLSLIALGIGRIQQKIWRNRDSRATELRTELAEVYAELVELYIAGADQPTKLAEENISAKSAGQYADLCTMLADQHTRAAERSIELSELYTTLERE
ncbi:MAG: hypothetical protein OXI44_11010 [Bacteroidota bacterium]|nr:hypothetical protein [Bacteroidota bacterium]